MNDDFLYRIRTEPPAHFAAALKQRLDSAPRRRARALRFGLGALLFGTAFAMMAVPGVRHSIASLFASGASSPVVRSAETESQAALTPPPHAPADATSAASREAPSTQEQRSGRELPQLTVSTPRPGVGPPDLALPDESTLDSEDDPSDLRPAALAARVIQLQKADWLSSDVPIVWPLPGDAAQEQSLMAVRRALFRTISNSFAPIDAMSRNRRELDRDGMALAAYRLVRLSTMIDDAYEIDTHLSTDSHGVIAAVWSARPLFRKEIREFNAAARALLESTAKGKPADILMNAGRVRGSCTKCHDRFVPGRALPPGG